MLNPPVVESQLSSSLSKKNSLTEKTDSTSLTTFIKKPGDFKESGLTIISGISSDPNHKAFGICMTYIDVSIVVFMKRRQTGKATDDYMYTRRACSATEIEKELWALLQ